MDPGILTSRTSVCISGNYKHVSVRYTKTVNKTQDMQAISLFLPSA